ncbi:MAG: 30S ribosomal protein S24e [Promethearchaeota archaeon]
MSYKIEIIDIKDNPLIKRKEIRFRVEHPTSGTPNRYEIKQKLAALNTVDDNLVFVKKLKTIFGSRHVIGRANIYLDKEYAEKFEPNYIKIRNLPKDQREEAMKKLKEAKAKKKKKKKT